MERLGDFLLTHIDGIAVYCDHPVRFGVVGSVNATIKGVLRRARGMRDAAFLGLSAPFNRKDASQMNDGGRSAGHRAESGRISL